MRNRRKKPIMGKIKSVVSNLRLSSVWINIDTVLVANSIIKNRKYPPKPESKDFPMLLKTLGLLADEINSVFKLLPSN